MAHVAFFLGDALDEHVNTLLSLGINRRNLPLRPTSTCPVISLVDTPEVKVRIHGELDQCNVSKYQLCIDCLNNSTKVDPGTP